MVSPCPSGDEIDMNRSAKSSFQPQVAAAEVQRAAAARPRYAAGLALAIGVAALVGCGGSITAPECSFFSNTCNPTTVPITFTFPPSAFVLPQRASVQVGDTVVLQVNVNYVDQASYQWRRSTDGGLSYVDIPGATGRLLTLTGLNLGDDGALFQVDVRSNGSSVLQAAGGQLAVSSMPPVTLQDSEFPNADWAEEVVAVPATNGPTATADHAAGGGNPGAFRTMAFNLSAGPSSLRQFNVSTALAYDPALRGAIKVIDFAEECSVSSTSQAIGFVEEYPLLVQGSRRYVTRSRNSCADNSGWTARPQWSSLAATDFVLAAGPACTAAESCPDFSATAAPLRFGYLRAATQAAGSPAGVIVHGIDNWQVAVWRR